jgi:hypothetical protein
MGSREGEIKAVSQEKCLEATQVYRLVNLKFSRKVCR